MPAFTGIKLSASLAIVESGRFVTIRMCEPKAFACYSTQEEYEQAATIINPDFQMDDIREGEISLSHLWFDLYRALLRKQHPTESEEQIAARQLKEYPLPAYLDFRMHDESERA